MILPAFLFGSIVNQPSQSTTSEAKVWLDQLADRVLGIDTTNFSHAQFDILRKLADKLQTRCYVSQHCIERGIPVPQVGTAEWEAAYDDYLHS